METIPTSSGQTRTAHFLVRVTDEAREVIRDAGGTLYVWTSEHACCSGPLTLLETSLSAPAGKPRHFERVAADGFDVLYARGLRRRPDELVIELRGRRRRVVAFWNDQAYVG